MANEKELKRKISQLPISTEIYGDEVFPIVQSGSTWKITFNTVLNWLLRTIGVLTSVATIDELRQLKPGFRKTVVLLGYYEAGDKEPLTYVYKSGSFVDDGGAFIVPSGDTSGAWVAVFNEGVSIKHFGASVSVNNNAPFIQKTIDNSAFILFPEGEFNITETVFLKNNRKYSGSGTKTVLTTSTPGIDMFVANKEINPESGLYFSELDNIYILSKTKLSNCVILNGFRAKISNFVISGGDKGLRLSGTDLTIENGYVVSNNYGIVIDEPTPGIHTTCVNLITVNFQYNGIGLTNVGLGQTIENGNIINLKVSNCVFEYNTKGFELIPFSYILENVWFEANDIKSTIWKFRGSIQNVRYNSVGQEIQFVESPGSTAYRGNVDIDNVNGVLSTSKLQMQLFDDNGKDISSRFKKAALIEGREIDSLVDGEGNPIGYISESNKNKFAPNGTEIKPFSLSGYISISPDGTLITDSLSDIIQSVVRDSVGTYTITFKGYTRGFFSVSATSPESISDLDTNSYYACVSSNNHLGHSDYQYGYFSRIKIHAYKKTAGASDELSDSFVWFELKY